MNWTRMTWSSVPATDSRTNEHDIGIEKKMKVSDVSLKKVCRNNLKLFFLNLQNHSTEILLFFRFRQAPLYRKNTV